MKKATLLFAVVLAIVVFSPAHSREALQPAAVHANLTSVSGPVAFSPVLQMAGGMVYGAGAQIQQAPEPPKLDVDIQVDKGERRWVVSPVWMAIGGLALLVLIALVVMGSRGGEGGTTVVRG